MTGRPWLSTSAHSMWQLPSYETCPPNIRPNVISRAIDRARGEQRAWLATRSAEYRLLGNRHREVASSLAIAAARLHVLPLRSELEAAVSAENDYVEKLGTDRTPELIAQWSDIRTRLLESGAYLDVGDLGG